MCTFNFSNKSVDASIFRLADGINRVEGIFKDYGLLAINEKGEYGDEWQVYVILHSGDYRVFRVIPTLRRGSWEFDCDDTATSYDDDADAGLLGVSSDLQGAKALIMSDLCPVKILGAIESASIRDMEEVYSAVAGDADLGAVESSAIRWGELISLSKKIAAARQACKEIKKCNVTRAHQFAKLAKIGNIIDFARKNLTAADAEKWIAATFAIRDLRRHRRLPDAVRNAGECYQAARLLLQELPRERRPELRVVVEHNLCWVIIADREFCIGGFGLSQEERENTATRINKIINK